MRHECWTSQGSLSCSPRKSVCHDWTATAATYNCMPGCKSIIAVIAIPVYGFCLCGIRNWKSRVVVFRAEGTFEPTTEGWVGRTGPKPWPGSSCDFTPLDNVSWDYVTEHIYIKPFGILLMDRNTENEYVLRPAVFWDCTQHRVAIPFWYFGISNCFHLLG